MARILQKSSTINSFDVNNVLLIGAGTQSLAFISPLANLGYKVYLLTEELNNYADASRYISSIIVPPVKISESSYIDYLLSVIQKNNISVIIPMGDSSAAFISKNLDALSAVVNVKMSKYENFLLGYDKNSLMSLCSLKGYPHPQTIDLSLTSIEDKLLKEFPYPAMLKPNISTGGRGMKIIQTYDDLRNCFEDLKSKYGNYHIQEFIPSGGKQFKAQLYIDDQGNLIQGTVMQKVRWFPISGGSNCCALSIENYEIVQLCHNVLKDLKWVGFADFDLIEDPRNGKVLLMEINPRVPACIKATMVAGVNWPEVIVNGYLNLPQKEYQYKHNVVLRHLGLDIMWFLKSDKRWKTSPSWFRFIGKNIHYQDMNGWMDLMPFIKGTFKNVKSLLNPEFKKNKGLI